MARAYSNLSRLETPLIQIGIWSPMRRYCGKAVARIRAVGHLVSATADAGWVLSGKALFRGIWPGRSLVGLRRVGRVCAQRIGQWATLRDMPATRRGSGGDAGHGPIEQGLRHAPRPGIIDRRAGMEAVFGHARGVQGVTPDATQSVTPKRVASASSKAA